MRSARAVPELAAWRDEARRLLAEGVAPPEVVWTAPGATGLLFCDAAAPATTGAPARVPARFLALAELAVLHRDPGGHALLYRALWRLAHGEPRLLDDAADPDVRALALRARAVRHDLHQMHAFVRFRQVDPEHLAAWYAPAHHVVAAAAPFFIERLGAERWSILTPDTSIAWDGAALHTFAGVPHRAAPSPDQLEELWRTYYASTFNPARVNPRLLRQHMPARYRPALAESAWIPELVARAAPRVGDMLEPAGAAVPATRSLPVLRDAAARCSACELCGPATQTVFGEGPADAALALVGEQPGDQEDLAGRPFIGPAGEVLDAALARAGIARDRVYVTNAVKHFRFLPRGKKRLHQRPTADQVRACKPWLTAELAAVAPRVVVCLGATAAHALIGSRFSVSRERGRVVATPWADHLLATHHPAAILRVDPDLRARYEHEVGADLLAAARLL